MTWREYYTSVMDEAFRRNGTVIWINPPRPVRAMVDQQGLPVQTMLSGAGPH